jgi:hypothetical protein
MAAFVGYLEKKTRKRSKQMVGRLINKKRRMRVREIARSNYIRQTGSRESVVFNSIVASQRQIKTEFGSGIITSLLISLMVKLAIKYIEKWAEENLFSYNVPEQFEEAR